MCTASIKALPPPTVQLIGSSQVLLDASSVVKELVENAMDARATSVSIEVSANILDLIQVRDNGHGIGPEDRGAVCKRYTTSKISDFADVRDLGGASLGFRGEALHSLVEMCGAVSVTTRVEGEATAVKLSIARDGAVEASATASHPVGTTVRATDFLNKLPVRKQTALKAVPKCLARIKRLLQAYALARPAVRISLRVLKAKSANGDFLYAPNAAAATVEDAVCKVLGKGCAAQCAWTVVESHGFELRAFLPTAEADVAQVRNIGAFLSVDSRPVAAARGILKQIVTLYRKMLRASSSSFEGVKDPFLYLDIVCAKGSYDPNVEPAKDDVIFDEGQKLMYAVEELLAGVYPDRNPPKAVSSLAVQEIVGVPDCEEPLLTHSAPERRDPNSEPYVEDEEGALLERQAPSWKPNMFGLDEDDADMLLTAEDGGPRPSDRPNEPGNIIESDLRLSNPWTMARMNAPVPSAAFQSSDTSEIELYRTPHRTPLPRRQATSLQPLPRNQFTPINAVSFGPINTDSSPYGLPTPQPSSSPTHGIPLCAIPEAPHRRKQLGVRPNAKASTSVVRSIKESNWFDFGPSSGSARRTGAREQKMRTDRDIRDVFGNTAGRKARVEPLVVQGDTEELVEVPGDATTPSVRSENEDHNNMSTSTPRAAPTGNTNPVEVTTHEIQPCPATRRRTTEGRRSKSLRLPLERVPAGSQLHNLILPVAITLRNICTGMSKLDKDANFISWYHTIGGSTTFTIAPSVAEIQVWSKRIVRALSTVSETNGELDQREVEAKIVAAVERAEWT